MEKKGGHFVRASALALAVHALLFLAVAQLVRDHLTAPTGVGLVEIQLLGDGGGGAGTGPAAKDMRGPRHAPQARSNATPSAAPSLTPALPAPTESSSRVQAPYPIAAPKTAASPAPAAPEQWPAVPGSAGGGNPGSGSDPTAGETGAGGGGWGEGSAGGSMGDLPATIADIDPVPLQPIVAPYPARARRLGQQGLVKVRAEIDDQGIVMVAQISVSSGFADLDNAALDAVKNARFLPAKKNGRSVPSIFVKPIRFRLQQGQSFSSQE